MEPVYGSFVNAYNRLLPSPFCGGAIDQGYPHDYYSERNRGVWGQWNNRHAGLSALNIPTKAFSRNAAALTLPSGVVPAQGDLGDIASVERAVAGSSTVFLLWPHLSNDGAQELVAALA